jgi:hypothetical protein
VPDEIPVRAGGSKVEPAAVRVKDRRALAGPRRFRPPAGDPSDGIGFEGHVRGSHDSLDDVVEWTAGSRSSELTLEWCDRSAKSGRRSGIRLAERMNSQPWRFLGCVSEHLSLHYRHLK